MKDINKISVNLRYSFNNDPPELKEIYAKNYKLLNIINKRKKRKCIMYRC